MLEIDLPAGNEQEAGAHIPSFEFVCTQYYQRVYHYFRIRLNNDEDTADLTQQVFFQLWLHMYSYQPERSSLSTWIFSQEKLFYTEEWPKKVSKSIFTSVLSRNILRLPLLKVGNYSVW